MWTPIRTRIGPAASALCASTAAATASAGPRERDEEGVALRVHLDAVVPREGVADRAPVLGEEIGVGRPVLLQQARRPLDVGEEERHRAGGQRAALTAESSRNASPSG